MTYCARCGGRMFWDADDRNYTCLQCGAVQWDTPPLPFVANVVTPWGPHRDRPVGKGTNYPKTGRLRMPPR